MRREAYHGLAVGNAPEVGIACIDLVIYMVRLGRDKLTIVGELLFEVLWSVDDQSRGREAKEQAHGH